MEITQVCSLGTLCHSAMILKRNALKKCSYPFDWTHSNCDMILHCIEDEFKTFLDKSQYISQTQTSCMHKIYMPQVSMFQHHNPVTNGRNYAYFCRCVGRFRQLLKHREHKLFTMMYVNKPPERVAEYKRIVSEFDIKLSNHTSNYTLLCIVHSHGSGRKRASHTLTRVGNVDFLEFRTHHVSTGTSFVRLKDNTYLNNLLTHMYTFNLQNPPTHEPTHPPPPPPPLPR